MWKKIVLATGIFSLCFVKSYAHPDSLKVKRVDHYVGVQVNELIRQIFNFNETDNPLFDNPYLLTYSFFFAKGKWGVHTGAGYRYNSLEAEESNNETKVNDVFYRAGIMRKSMLGRRVQVGYGLDYAGEYHDDITTSSTVVDFGSGIDSTYSKISTKTNTLGGGVHLELAVYITPRLLIGTETNYYFAKSTEKENTFVSQTVVSFFSGFTETNITNTNDKTETKEFAITVPSTIFLIVKF